MKTTSQYVCLLCTLGLLCLTCGGDGPNQGGEGQPCYPNDTCNAGLTCDQGTCEDRCGDSVCGGSETAVSCPDDCHALPACGDGVCNAGEHAGNCPADCTPRCGDGLAEGGEVCDGADTAGESCVSQGLSGGVLGCSADCLALDPSTCSDSCGDGTLGSGEICDGADVGATDCTDFGFPGGTLGCAADCAGFDLSGCALSVCGNGVIEEDEVCDASELTGASCLDYAEYNGGDLGCASDCAGYDTTGCWHATCGNLVVEGDETCDGTALGGLGCEDLGFGGGGALDCVPACDAFDTSQCAGSACDLSGGGCTTCLSCTETTACATEFSNCAGNADCTTLEGCVMGCGGMLSCVQTCRADHTLGATDFEAKYQCALCDACATDCLGWGVMFDIQCP